jgi:oligopeptide transport system substrate-binding protein
MRYHPFVRLAVILVILLTVGLTISCGGGSKVAISTLTVVPAKPTPDLTVTIGANVLNSGTKSEAYSATLKINGAVVETKQLTIGAGETKVLSFQYTPKTLGSFRVDVNGQTGNFDVVKPAAFVAESLTVTPDVPVQGSELTASIKVRNTGDLSGSYTAALKVDGKDIKTTAITLDAGGSQTVTFNFSCNVSGNHIVDINGMSKEIKVLKPAEFKGTSVSINPASVLPGQAVTIEANVTNVGDVKDTKPVALMVNGSESSSKSLTLEPGASGKVTYTLTPDTSGSYNINVLSATGSLTVNDYSKYANKGTYFNNYTISYPPDFSVKENKQNVSIEKTDVGGISVVVERVSTSLTAKAYFDVVAQAKKKGYPDWIVASQTDIVEGGTVIGYKYDYSNTINGKKWLGRAMVIKKAGLGYYVGFSANEAEWKNYQTIAGRCVDSFAYPKSFSGSYTNAALGVAFTLPTEWTVTETGVANPPLYFYSPHNLSDIEGLVIFESVSTEMSAKQYIDSSVQSAVAKGWAQGTGKTFTFTNGAVGYESMLSAMITGGVAYEYRFYSLVSGGRAYMFRFDGPSASMTPQSNSIIQLVKSLVVSKPGGVEGVNRNEALFLLDSEIPTLDPAIVETGPGDIVGAIFSGLVRIDKDLKIVPDLAESWKVSDDGKTYTFSLRKNAKFHDGRQVTAADFKYSWERACDPAVKSPKASSFLADIAGAKERLAGTAPGISGVKVVDDYTLEVTLVTAKPYFLGEIAQPVAFVVDKANVAKGARWYEQPNGTGPFKMKTWQKDSLLVLERNDSFYLEPAKLKNLVFKLFAGNSMQLYENGEIDITGVSTTNQDKVLDPANSLNKELVTGFSYDIAYVAFNITKAPFDDPKIRQALAMAIDVNKLIDVTLKGRAERATGFVPPGIPGNNPALQPLPYDLEKAKQLIKDSKYQSADKVPPITMYVVYGVSSTQQAIIGMWQSLGLQVNTQVISNLQDYYDRVHRKEFQTYVTSWRADYIDPQNFLEIFFQSQSPENGFAYNNPDVDAALAKAGMEKVEATRIKMYQDIEKIVLNDLPAVPLWWKAKTYTLVKPYVKGYVALPVDINIWREISVLPH